MTCDIKDYNKLSKMYKNDVESIDIVVNIMLVCKGYRPATYIEYFKDYHQEYKKFRAIIRKIKNIGLITVRPGADIIYNKGVYTKEEVIKLYNKGDKSLGKLLGFNCPMEIMKMSKKWKKIPKYSIEYIVFVEGQRDQLYVELCDKDPRGSKYLEKQNEDFQKLAKELGIKITQRISVKLPDKTEKILL
jgi:hypothetical protein